MAIVELTCICCPMGCPLTVGVTESGEVLSVTGQSCRRGAEYGRHEAIAPERMLTYVVPVCDRLEPLSVKTAQPIPKRLMADVVEQLRQLEVQPPVEEGAVVLEDAAGTGIAVVATKTIR